MQLPHCLKEICFCLYKCRIQKDELYSIYPILAIMQNKLSCLTCNDLELSKVNSFDLTAYYYPLSSKMS